MAGEAVPAPPRAGIPLDTELRATPADPWGDRLRMLVQMLRGHDSGGYPQGAPNPNPHADVLSGIKEGYIASGVGPGVTDMVTAAVTAPYRGGEAMHRYVGSGGLDPTAKEDALRALLDMQGIATGSSLLSRSPGAVVSSGGARGSGGKRFSAKKLQEQMAAELKKVETKTASKEQTKAAREAKKLKDKRDALRDALRRSLVEEDLKSSLAKDKDSDIQAMTRRTQTRDPRGRPVVSKRTGSPAADDAIVRASILRGETGRMMTPTEALRHRISDPIRTLHGTSAADNFTQFDESMYGTGVTGDRLGPGTYLDTSDENALWWAHEQSGPRPRLLDVDIHASPEEMIDWGRGTISEQSPLVRRLVEGDPAFRNLTHEKKMALEPGRAVELMKIYYKREYGEEWAKALTRALRRHGIAGSMIKNESDGFMSEGTEFSIADPRRLRIVPDRGQ